MLTKPRSRRIATLLALAGVVPIFGCPHLVGLHKLYLGQRWWCFIYVVLALTGSEAAWIACLFDAIFYLVQNPDEFDINFNAAFPAESSLAAVATLSAGSASISDALRELDQLRQDGLISEYEFEQKRRKLVDRI
jgi:TM2 domain-containing membrane protein YozV